MVPTGTVSFKVHSSPPCSVLLSILVNARKKNTEIFHILLPRPFIIREAYIALYSSSDYLSDMLKDNLTIDGSVSYIINDRNAVVASSDVSLSGIYLLDYDTIEESFMSSNNFIERNILDTTVYAGFYNIPNGLWLLSCLLVH